VTAPNVTAAAIPISVDRVVTYLKWCRVAVWSLCAGGMWMGLLVSEADRLAGARFTALSGLPGWPETWGCTLMTLGAVSLASRLVGRRAVHVRAAKLDGNMVAAAAMFGMSMWYTIFAASLILGTAQYGYAPYLTLAGLHWVFAIMVYRTEGFRPSRRARV
jgi:hypothetical protein